MVASFSFLQESYRSSGVAFQSGDISRIAQENLPSKWCCSERIGRETMLKETETPTMSLLAVAGRTLHSQEMDNLLETLASHRISDDLPTIDLSHLTFMTPSGMVWLLATLRGLGRVRREERRDPMLRILAPTTDNPRVRLHYWLRWMGFYDFLDSEGIVCERRPSNTPLPPEEERSLKSETLLVLTALRSSQDVARVVERVSGVVASLLKRHLAYTPRDVANLGMMLSEACHNIIDHAGAGACGWVAAQVVRRPKQEPYVMIGIGDDGMGIRTSLEHAYPESRDWSDVEVIQQALRRGISGVADADRGLGLWSIRETIPTYRGTLHVRSGRARIRLKATQEGEMGEDAYTFNAALPGTLLCLTLRKRRVKNKAG